MLEQNERHRERLHLGQLTNRKEASPRFRGEVAVVSNQAGPRSSVETHDVFNNRGPNQKTRYRISQSRAGAIITCRGVLDRYYE